MRNKIKVLSILLTGCCLLGCTEKNLVSFDEKVKNIARLGFVTGADGFYNTVEMGLGGCDLGYPVYIDDIDMNYYFFGDSFSQANQSGAWRSNIALFSNDFNFADGLVLDDAIKTKSGLLKPIYDGMHSDNGEYEITRIPTGVCYVKGSLYMFYFSMFDWNLGADVKMNYGGCIKSSDFGETWERLHDLTWVNIAPDQSVRTANDDKTLTKLVNLDSNNMERTENLIDIKDHYGWDATQIYPLQGKDGYVYLFLEGGYRNHHLKCARVLENKIEEFNEYEYLQKYDDNGNPIWQKGYEGLKSLFNNKDSEITQLNFGEMSGLYNPYLQKWCLLSFTGGGKCTMVTSDKIYGPYVEEYHLYTGGTEGICPNNPTTNQPMSGGYAPMTNEKMLADNGKTMYMLTSTWMPCYNPSLIEVKFK